MRNARKLSISDILGLSAPERIQLAEDIWDSVVTIPKAVSLTLSQRKELDQRLKAYHENPEAGSPWEEVKSKLRRNQFMFRSRYYFH